MKIAYKVNRAALTCVMILAAHVVFAGPILVGQVAPMSGPEASQGRAYRAGMQLYFAAVNKSGGVNGNTFVLITRDDGGRPEDTLTQTKSLLAEDKPMVLAGFFGSKNIRDLLASGLLNQERIALVGYRTSEIAPSNQYLFNVRAGLTEEVNKLTEHLATIGITRLGLFYEEGNSAPALINLADQAASKVRAKFTIRASYPEGSQRVRTAVEVLTKSSPQAIILVSSGAATAAFIDQYRSGGGTAQLFAHSGADIEQLSKRLADEQLQGVAITQVTPNPYKISVRLTKEFNDLAAKAPDLGMPVSYSMMEGYIVAKVLVEAVRRQGMRPSRDGLATALANLEVDLGGYVINYKGEMRNGSKQVDMSIVTAAGKIRQ